MLKFFKSLARAIYSYIPFKKNLFFLIKKVFIPPQKIYQHLYFNDKFKVDINANQSFLIHHFGSIIENELFWRGIDGWEPVSMKLWVKLCQRSQNIVDIGANTGIYSLIAATVNPSATVHAFDPVDRVYQRLKRNIELNKYKIIAHPLAVSNQSGKAKIFDLPTDHVLSVTVNKNLNSADQPVIEKEIRTITLDSFIERENLNSIDLIKIDAETHEPEILEGFNKYIDAFRPAMLVEILTEDVARRIQNMVKDLDYLYFDIDENSSYKQVTNLNKSSFYNYLLCSQEVAENAGIIDKK